MCFCGFWHGVVGVAKKRVYYGYLLYLYTRKCGERPVMTSRVQKMSEQMMMMDHDGLKLNLQKVAKQNKFGTPGEGGGGEENKNENEENKNETNLKFSRVDR